MLPLPITKRDAEFLINGEVVGTVKRYDGEFVEPNSDYSNYIEIINPKRVVITGRLFGKEFERCISVLTEEQKRYLRRTKRYLRRCNRWRIKNNLQPLARW